MDTGKNADNGDESTTTIDEERGPAIIADDTKQEKATDPNAIDFDGPNDPENPMNWSSTKKSTSLAIVSFITFLSPIGSTIPASGAREIMEEFHSDSDVLAILVTTIYLLGYAFGPLAIAPLSELYGRDIMYKTCNVLFVVFSIACAVANSLDSLIVFRLFTGIAGSCPMTLGPSSIADMVPRESRGLWLSAWTAGPLLGPTIGPIAGGYLTPVKGWRWGFWFLAITMGACVIFTFLFMRESNAYVILQRKAARMRKETGNQKLKSTLDTGKTPKRLLRDAIFRPVKLLALPIVFLLSLYVAVVYGYVYLCFATFPRIFQAQYGFETGPAGLATLGIAVGSLLGLIICGTLSDRLVARLTKRNGGEPKPEYRLPTLTIGGLFVPIGLFWYAWTADKQAHWALPIIGTGWLGAGLVIVYMAAVTYLVDAYTAYSASAIAASTVMRSLAGTLLPLAGTDMYDTLGVGWGTSLLGFISIAFIPLPFIFFKYGEAIRKSRLFGNPGF